MGSIRRPSILQRHSNTCAASTGRDGLYNRPNAIRKELSYSIGEPKMRKTLTVSLLCLSLLSPLPGFTQGSGDTEIYAKIRKEGMENSQIMRTLHFLTDVYGPRLTGSPNHKNAAEWAIKQMSTWGFENGHLEPWDFGHPGWLNERLT